MKTTELFAEQVLIGLLVILIAGLLIYDHANPIINVSDKSPLELIVTAGLLLGTAYLVGMVYDRVSDTLLQDLESHCRLLFVAEMKPEENLKTLLEHKQDPFEEGKYRIMILGNGQATQHMDYLRSRIRLTRSLTTLLPAMMVSFLLAMDYGKASSCWKLVAVTIPFSYALTLALKMRKGGARPPKTYEDEKLREYLYDCVGPLDGASLRLQSPLTILFQDQVGIPLSLLAIAATALILSTRSYARFSVLFAGLVLTIIVGWSWWRISRTYYSFLRDYERFGGCKPGCQDREAEAPNLKTQPQSNETTKD